MQQISQYLITNRLIYILEIKVLKYHTNAANLRHDERQQEVMKKGKIIREKTQTTHKLTAIARRLQGIPNWFSDLRENPKIEPKIPEN